MKSEKMSVVFTIHRQASALVKALGPFQKNEVILTHIESRPLAEDASKFKCLCNLEITKEEDEARMDKAIEEMKEILGKDCVKVLSSDTDNTTKDSEEVPWFPTKITDLDRCGQEILSYGVELDADHPGFKDEEYRKRRLMFAEIAYKYRHGDPIPHVEYTEEEIATWGAVFTRLSTMADAHACKEYRRMWPSLVEKCAYSKDNIPQLDVVSNFVQKCTGFIIRPAAGLLTMRDFLAGFAFRVYNSTQYIRHGANPFYTPEPDICHELLGHIPMFCDPDFAALAQEIGFASLGASDEWIDRLGSLYWFTVEFGLCKEEGDLKVYGAAALSSIEELKNCLSDSSKKLPFDCQEMSLTTYPMTTLQEVYFVSDTFTEAKRQIKEFTSKIPKPFTLHYDPYTQSVQLLNKQDNCAKRIHDLANEMKTLEDAVKKLVQ